MEAKKKLYIINGSDVLSVILMQESEQRYTDIKLLRNLDRLVDYLTANMGNGLKDLKDIISFIQGL